MNERFLIDDDLPIEPCTKMSKILIHGYKGQKTAQRCEPSATHIERVMSNPEIYIIGHELMRNIQWRTCGPGGCGVRPWRLGSVMTDTNGCMVW